MADRYLWLGKYPIAQEDQDRLEGLMMQYAKEGQSEDVAADSAFKKYVKNEMIQAAAWHLINLKAARSTDQQGRVKEHAFIYKLLLQALGCDIYAPTPTIIASLSKTMKPSDRYQGHQGDTYLYDGQK